MWGVVVNERDRIAEAMIDVACERGYKSTTVAAVVDRAGLDSAVFERHFNGKDECFLWIFDREARRFNEVVLPAHRRGADWRDGLRSGAYEAARFIRDNPREAHFGTVVLFEAGDLAQAHRDALLQQHVELIDSGRQELDDPDSVTRATAEWVIGSVYGLLAKEFVAGDPKDPLAMVPQLMYMAVRPYLGHEAAREELNIPPPPEQAGPGEGGS